MNILHIDCSPKQQSHSRNLSAAILERLTANEPHAIVTRRDLGLHPIPHPGPDYAIAVSSPDSLTPERLQIAVELSEQLIQELETADTVIVGTPMNNFTVPSVLKAWIDQVLRMRRTIGRSPNGEKIGLLSDRQVYIGVASGGVFTGDGANQPDFLIPYLTAAFEVVGIRSLQFFALQGTAALSQDELIQARANLLETVDQ